VRKILLFIVLTVLCSVAVSHKSLAAQNPQQPPSGVTLSPAVVQAAITSSEPDHLLTFTLTNNTNKAQAINISTADFNTLDESGGLVFVGTNPTKLQKKYGLATWITLPQTTVTLQPKQPTKITAILTNQDSLAPGGHYGALLLGLTNNSASQSNQNKVALHPIASSLLFVNKVGGDTHKLRLTDVYANHNIFKLPGSVTLRFYNSGNTHVIPRGTIEVTDPKGKLVSRGIINENSGIILPETYRRYSVALKNFSNPAIPGKYKITVNFRFDGYEQFRTYQTTQFLLTPLLVIFFVIFLAGLLAIIFSLKNHKVRKQLGKFKKHLKFRT
jgi:hypothetical protein